MDVCQNTRYKQGCSMISNQEKWNALFKAHQKETGRISSFLNPASAWINLKNREVSEKHAEDAV